MPFPEGAPTTRYLDGEDDLPGHRYPHQHDSRTPSAYGAT